MPDDHYGDADEAVNSTRLLRVFCTFHQRVLYAWLESEQLCVRSEGTILRLLVEWYADQFDMCTDAAAQAELLPFMASLATLVRVPFLPPYFITHLVADNIPWFSPWEHLLPLCSMTNTKMDLSLLDKDTSDQLPAAWLSTKPRPPAPLQPAMTPSASVCQSSGLQNAWQNSL